jgi:hypothetical protein
MVVPRSSSRRASARAWAASSKPPFGNAAESIIAFAALRAGLHDVVKASLVGSIVVEEPAESHRAR